MATAVARRSAPAVPISELATAGLVWLRWASRATVCVKRIRWIDRRSALGVRSQHYHIRNRFTALFYYIRDYEPIGIVVATARLFELDQACLKQLVFLSASRLCPLCGVCHHAGVIQSCIWLLIILERLARRTRCSI